MQTFDEPPTIDNYHGHPFLASLQTSATDAGDPSSEGTQNGAQEDTQPAASAGKLQWGASPAQRRSFGGGAPGGRAASPALRPHRFGSETVFHCRVAQSSQPGRLHASCRVGSGTLLHLSSEMHLPLCCKQGRAPHLTMTSKPPGLAACFLAQCKVGHLLT